MSLRLQKEFIIDFLQLQNFLSNLAITIMKRGIISNGEQRDLLSSKRKERVIAKIKIQFTPNKEFNSQRHGSFQIPTIFAFRKNNTVDGSN